MCSRLNVIFFFVGVGILGSLPPPSLLASLPVATSSMFTPSSSPGSSLFNPSVPPPHSLHNSWLSSSPASGHHLGASPVMSSLSRPAMILSPASDPIPHSLVQRIQSGQYIDMRELLADNIALLNQVSTMNPMIPITTSSQTRLREIPSLVSWLYCFLAYTAVRTSDPSTRDILAYSRLIIREALRHGNNGWLEYDRVFRRQISINPLMLWNTLEPSLQASTMLGQRSSAGSFCTLCRECDHIAQHCALAPLQQQVNSGPAYNSSQPSGANRPPKRPETLMHICVSWNKGTCRRPASCTYRHICATCQLVHKARDCADTPANSEYKLIAPATTSSGIGRPPAGRS